MAAECRGCGALILWAINRGSGKPMPVDRAPVEGGNVILHREDERGLYCDVVAPDPGVIRHVSHYVTCPKASRFRALPAPGQQSLGL